MPDRCETDTGAESGDHQCQFAAITGIVSYSHITSHLNGTSHQYLYQAETWKKKKKIYAGKENSAIRVNYPGRKSVPRWPVTRGEIIKTKGMEGSADQREARDVA